MAFEEPWNFQTPDATKRRRARAGSVAIDASLELAPTVFEDEARYGAFLQTVILRAHLAQLDDDALARAFLTQMREAGATDAPPWSLDYVRLNAAAKKPT